MKPTIVVTGATGKTGAAVVAQLRSRDIAVRAIVHSDDARSAALRSQGVDVVVADLFDVEQLTRSLRGAQRAYYCPPWHPHMLDAAVGFAAAAREAKLEAIVGLSQWLASPMHPSLATRQSWLVDQVFATMPGIAHTTVNPGFFADNYLRLIGFASQLGIFPMPLGVGRNAPPSNEDIARVVVGALLDPARHAGKSYRPTGPALLDAREIAAVLQRVLGRRVRHIELPMWMFMKALRALGVDKFQQTGLRHYIEEHKRGTFELGAPTSHVRDVAGVDAEDFESIVRRYAKRAEVAPTLRNRIAALWDFMRIGVTPAFALDRFERAQQFASPSSPQLALDSPRWRVEHVEV